MVKIKSIDKRVFQDTASKKDLKLRLKRLTDASGLPEYMGELLLSELKLSTDEANRHLRERARLLGLM